MTYQGQDSDKHRKFSHQVEFTSQSVKFDDLILNIKADINIHNLHVWTLAGDKIVGTVHIKLINVELDKFNQVNS